MTEEIKLYIDRIRSKTLELHQLLVLEREQMSTVSKELTRLTELVENQSQVIEELTEANNSLTEELTIQRNNAIMPQSSDNKDVAIDVLVREIDFCIEQLKIANE